MKRILIVLLTMHSSLTFAYCFNEAGQRYGINPHLLKAIAQTESSMKPDIESKTNDIGLMGINRSWLPKLYKEFGITTEAVVDAVNSLV